MSVTSNGMRWQSVGKWARRLTVAILVAGIIFLLLWCIFLLLGYVPDALVRRHANPSVASAWISAVAGLLGVGATAAVAVAAFWYSRSTNNATIEAAKDTTGRTVEAARATNQAAIDAAREAQFPDRYTKAIEQVGSDNLDVRIGGIYALEGIAAEYARHQPTVMEFLAAFIREHSGEQWPTTLPSSGSQPERTMRPDVQTALTVMGRRMVEHDRRPIDLSGADLTDANLAGAKFASADFTGAALTRADLTDADLTDADLTGVNFSNANLTHTRLTSAFIIGADFTHANLKFANLTYAGVDPDSFEYSPIKDEYRIPTKFCHADLSDADLSGAQLVYADLSEASLQGSKLIGAYAHSTHFTGANFSGADLTDADLTDADLRGAFLYSTILRGAKLGRAQLDDAYFGDADLTGTDLTGTDLSGADLSDAKGHDGDAIQGGKTRESPAGD